MSELILDVYEDDFGQIQPITLIKPNGALSDDTSWAVEADSNIVFTKKNTPDTVIDTITSTDFTLDDTNKILNWTPTQAQIATLIAEIVNGNMASLDGFVKLRKNAAPARSETHKFTIRIHKS